MEGDLASVVLEILLGQTSPSISLPIVRGRGKGNGGVFLVICQCIELILRFGQTVVHTKVSA